MRHEVTTRRLRYEIPGMAAIQGEEGEFQGAGGMALAMRTYAPPSSSNPRSAVVIVDGYPDAGFSERLGCRFMDMEWSIPSRN